MAYCPHCGKEVNDAAVICVNCGCSVKQDQYKAPAIYDAPNSGYGFLGFFFPLVGLILYLVWKNETPLRAKSAGKGALIGVIVQVILYIIIFILYFFFLFSVIKEGAFNYSNF